MISSICLLFAIVMGVSILRRRKDRIGALMGSAVLILGIGDAFHLIPRVINYFGSGDYTAYLGFGKLITSITMTVFYLLMYRLWLRVYGEKEDRKLTITIYILAAVRFLLCLLPQNGWLRNDGSVLWGVFRNIPFVALGGVIVYLYYRKRATIMEQRSPHHAARINPDSDILRKL